MRAMIVAGMLLAGLAVALGAFGAHGLENRVTPSALAIWQTGVQYQFVHALGLLLVAALWPRLNPRPAVLGATAFGLGILLFCGSLYALALGAPRMLGMIAPIGGSLFILGWIVLAIAALRKA